MAKSNVFPLADRMLVEVIPDEVAKSGIIIPDDIKPKPKQATGKVIVVGPGRYDQQGNKVPLGDIQPGDIVLFDRASGIPVASVSTKEREVVLVREPDAYAVIRTK